MGYKQYFFSQFICLCPRDVGRDWVCWLLLASSVAQPLNGNLSSKALRPQVCWASLSLGHHFHLENGLN